MNEFFQVRHCPRIHDCFHLQTTFASEDASTPDRTACVHCCYPRQFSLGLVTLSFINIASFEIIFMSKTFSSINTKSKICDLNKSPIPDPFQDYETLKLKSEFSQFKRLSTIEPCKIENLSWKVLLIFLIFCRYFGNIPLMISYQCGKIPYIYVLFCRRHLPQRTLQHQTEQRVFIVVIPGSFLLDW